jgi:uncharacterized membrane protein YhaH (DUF805 family)
MKWYFKVFKQYADFSGRARRKEYWMFMLFNIIAVFVIVIADNVFNVTPMRGMPLGTLYCMYIAAMLIPMLAVSVRRLHDTGKSGWWIFINLIPFPFVGSIWFLVLMLTEGEQDANPYGANPKEHDGYGVMERKRNAAVVLILAACFCFIRFLSGTIFYCQPPFDEEFEEWTLNILPDIIPIVALLIAGIALLQKKKRTTVAAIALLTASGILLLFYLYYHYYLINTNIQYFATHLVYILFQTPIIIEIVTLGIAGLALLLPKVKLRITLVIALRLFILLSVVKEINRVHTGGFYLYEMLYKFVDFVINQLPIVEPIALLVLAYAFLPNRTEMNNPQKGDKK